MILHLLPLIFIMQSNVTITEKLIATRIEWQNCINIQCEFLANCQSVKPNEIICKKFEIKPYTIYRNEFIKIGDTWVTYDGE